jgi:CheY-like chemotaxis protein
MHSPVKILLVEDDEIDAEALSRELKKQNISNQVHRAASGIDALEMLRGENQRQKLEPPYVMLVDINMPRMNGLEFLKEVRKDHALRESIAFILTTSSREADVAQAYELNAAGYFLKNQMNKLIDMLNVYRHINNFPTPGYAGYPG